MNNCILKKSVLIITGIFVSLMLLACAYFTVPAEAASSGASVTVRAYMKGSNAPLKGVTCKLINDYECETPIREGSTATEETLTTDENGIAVFSDLYENEDYCVQIEDFPEGLICDYYSWNTSVRSGNTCNVGFERGKNQISARVYWTFSVEHYDWYDWYYNDKQDVYGILEYKTADDEWKQAPGSSVVKAVKADNSAGYYRNYGIIEFRNSDDENGAFYVADESGNKIVYRVREVDKDGNDFTPIGYTKVERMREYWDDYQTHEILNVVIMADLQAKVIWKDVPDDEPKPDVYVALYRKDGEEETRLEPNDESRWFDEEYGDRKRYKIDESGTRYFHGRSAYTQEGQKIHYFMKEIDENMNEWTNDKYEVIYDGMTATNVYTARPSLKVSVKACASKAKAGDVIPYTIIIRNDGNGTAYDLEVTDAAGPGLEYVSDDAEGAADGNNVKWTVRIPEGESKEIHLNLKAAKDQMSGYDNKVSLAASDANPAAEGGDKASCNVAYDMPKASEVELLRGTPSGKKAVKLAWTAVDGASSYAVYGNLCNKASCKKIKVMGAGSTALKIKKIGRKKLKSHKAYKFYVEALDANGNVIARSEAAHVITARTMGKKYANAKSITASEATLSLSPGGHANVNASVKTAKKKKPLSKGHAPLLRFVSDNPGVASVDAAGNVTANKPGICNIYIITVNGMWCSTSVSVTQ